MWLVMQEEMFLFCDLFLNINLFNQLPSLFPKTGVANSNNLWVS
jgi:hypothetical protein